MGGRYVAFAPAAAKAAVREPTVAGGPLGTGIDRAATWGGVCMLLGRLCAGY